MIDDALWDKVKLRQSKLREDVFKTRNVGHTPGTEMARLPSYILSGLLECADCGSGYRMINQERMAAQPRGTKVPAPTAVGSNARKLKTAFFRA